MDKTDKKPRINGALMSQYQNSVVCLLGNVNHVDPNGNFFQLNTSDNQKVIVRLNEPIQDMLQDLVEVHGIVKKNEIQCLNYVPLNHQGQQPFDMSAYDKAIQFSHRYREHYITM